MKVKMMRKILEANDRIAENNRHILSKAGLLTLNLMSAPGAGKTTLLSRTIRALDGRIRIGVIEGDIQGTHDAEVISALHVPVVQINTEGACHLDANMIADMLHELPLDEMDLLVIENVGNLVCPAEFDVGEDAKVMVLSITEGDDKPLKYPLMFQKSEVLILNKIDLLPHLDVDLNKIKKDVRALNRGMEIFDLSCKSGEGLIDWIQWLEKRMGRLH
ncbi:MAG: hydrogenase accessory protein HypB [Nitrospirae bacterium CG_4_9_14_3_um_filter_53_35]|nr:MAG: hydrogenase accessory protein HypB [Nitrospirae bacterium CG2_30_53_67]PIS36311.1 MAG: hydrogenase accessory protein HypB [Nitrospirae bacterium CG08_land_8_20_14_0_20_52_24]PIV85437.1 MAG: hydrogenase accessory protein HypB [Nitrospirae bacterium CG17_big_fil_post_rev_8_21_14_2_50_50_9]PIW85073.1 MAG: hydrogenase accessory protein HypB [Nitrospirae bacterium CG_4_8_14_3_um_filter_50_41]PIX85533.1 MAG: hydrogenase accessory protein HypB [Nitrospirae bacterium CG_4_10_14_3_um_filter_53_4